MDTQRIVSILRIASIVLLVAGGLTLLPSPRASKPSLLGYRAKCSFSPVSTAILLAAGAGLLVLRQRLAGRGGAAGRCRDRPAAVLYRRGGAGSCRFPPEGETR